MAPRRHRFVLKSIYLFGTVTYTVNILKFYFYRSSTEGRYVCASVSRVLHTSGYCPTLPEYVLVQFTEVAIRPIRVPKTLC